MAEQVDQVERLGRLKRFFSPSVVDLLLSGSAEDPLKSHRREIAAAFLDLRGFTAFTETSDPEDVMGVIREYHEAMGPLAMAHGGTIERFAGDGIMIFFNDPVPIDDAAATAVKMAIAMQERFATLAQGWHRRGYELGMGIGVAQGYATIGAIGFEGRRDYGAIGTVTQSCRAPVRRGRRRTDPHFAARAGPRRGLRPYGPGRRTVPQGVSPSRDGLRGARLRRCARTRAHLADTGACGCARYRRGSFRSCCLRSARMPCCSS